MTSEHLLEAMGLLDDELIQEAEGYSRPRARTGRRQWLAWAASFAVVILLGYGVSRLGTAGGGSAAPEGYSGAAAGGNAAASGVEDGASNSGAEALPGQAGGNGITSDYDCSGAGEPDASVGIQGLPEDQEPSSEADWRAAIMVDGTVYWSTGVPVPGEVDESAIRTVTSYTDARPEEDGQTNFDRSLTTRYAMTDLGLVVLMDGEWILFEPVPPGER